MSEPRVSIVMNVRNGAPYLREAIDSVLAQSFSDWELIVWDDCSTDDSAAIVLEHRDTRIRYFLSPEDTALGPARKLALREARGEWVAFLDQDDIWLPEKLFRQMEIADADLRGRVGLIYGRTVEFFSDGRERDFDRLHEFRDLPEGDLFEELFRKSCFVAMSSAMFRRSALQSVGEVPEEFSLISDFFLFVSVCRRQEARAVQEVVCRYRRHANSLSHNSRLKIHQEALINLRDWEGELPLRVASHARRSYHTAIAIAELSHFRSIARGTQRLLLHGSPTYVLSRPFARLLRRAHLRLGRPRWKFPDGHSRPVGPPPAAAPAVCPYPLELSVIVVNWKVRDLLLDCLRSLYSHLHLPAGTWELIVVDNNSGDGTVEAVSAEFPDAILLDNDENVGFARANNQAFLHCRGRYVLLLNPDVVLLDSAIDRMLEILKLRSEAAVLGCRLLNSDLSLQRWTAGAAPGLMNIVCHFLFVYRFLPAAILPRPLFLENEPPRDTAVGWVSGACMLLRREALGDRIFDERFFMYGEDLHLCQSLIKAGWTVVYTPRAQVVHHGGRSIENQTPEVQLNKLTNLRKVFTARNGPASVVYFDSVVSAGFLLRSIGFAVAAATRPGHGYDLRAAKSRQFLAEAVRSFGSR